MIVLAVYLAIGFVYSTWLIRACFVVRKPRPHYDPIVMAICVVYLWVFWTIDWLPQVVQNFRETRRC